MTKKEISAIVADKANIGNKEAEELVGIVLDTIADAVSKGKEVTFRGFGTFRLVHRKERQGRNIGKGTAITIPAKDVPSFKPSKNFSE